MSSFVLTGAAIGLVAKGTVRGAVQGALVAVITEAVITVVVENRLEEAGIDISKGTARARFQERGARHLAKL